MKAINLSEKLSRIHDHWHPRIAAELNGQQVKLVKIKGEFDWHSHASEDELFLVIEGSFDMHFRDRIEPVHAGEMIVVPRGIEHKPVAASEAAVLLFEPASTLNTGNIRTEKTRDNLQKI